MKKVLLIIILAVLLSGCSKSTILPTREITINGKTLTVEVAQTNQARSQGLSGRESLCDSCGMLFIFNTSAQYSFWMKDMNFPLDLIWLKNGVVQEITLDLPKPLGNELPAQVTPKSQIDAVLEVRAGQAKALGIEIGQKIEGI